MADEHAHATPATGDAQAHAHGQADGHARAHKPGELHLPHGSIWPFWLACAIALFGLGAILFGNSIPSDGDDLMPEAAPMWTLALVGAGLAAMVYTLVGWFREDFRWWNDSIGTGEHVPKAGTLLFISSEVFLFGALFASYFTYRSIAPFWPDTEVELPLLKTGIFSLFLFASSYTAHRAEGHIKRGNKRAFNNWWLATIVLGAIFLGGQVNEYVSMIREGATLGSSSFMTAFFMLTGTHGLHVFGGLCYLIIVYVRSRKGQFTAERHAAPQTASLYWHFVDFVWVIVFSVLYLANHDWSQGLGGL